MLHNAVGIGINSHQKYCVALYMLSKALKMARPHLVKSPMRLFSAADTPNIAATRPEKLFEYSPDLIGRTPFYLNFMDPYFEHVKTQFLTFIDYTGMPVPLFLILACVTIRSTLIPLVYVQMKKLGMFGTKLQFLKEFGNIYRHSSLSKMAKASLAVQLYAKTSKKFRLQSFKLFSYNLVHIPLLIMTVVSLRKTIGSEQLKNQSFLWVDKIVEYDPYYILPLMTCALYYFHFGRGITPLNENMLISKIKRGMQMIMLLWFPILSYWPSGIVFYMFLNALYSLVFVNFTSSLSFMKRVNPKMLFMLIFMNRGLNSERIFHLKLKQMLPKLKSKRVDEDQIMYRAKEDLKR